MIYFCDGADDFERSNQIINNGEIGYKL